MSAPTDIDRPRVLVVEDDPALSEVVCTFLGDEGYACAPAFSGTEALLAAERAAEKNEPYDLVILDLMLPGVPGEELLGRLRAEGVAAPVIVTSAKGALSDRVGVLRLGASDYLVKPFDLEELLARVEVQLRGRAGSRGATLRFGRWELDPAARTFSVDGRPLRLTRTEFDILAALMRDPRRVFTKQALFELVRHEEALTDERTISTHVSNLRSKLRETGTDGYIQTVWGIGFKLG
ncbi:response regulator transcription factor [Olsenella profusa]|uniref:Response regulator transcription factor n=1 Tax=Olsenella profusa TaxID=138595 RepID=A0ABS2F090_9ACTN|nr:response regulator transcription factor [Olsenella profusa]MBM6774292.1 response regulator transcription factor [Olsenella profusa]